MMTRPASHTCAQAAHFFLARRHAFAYNSIQQHPPRLSTMRTRGVTFLGFRRTRNPTRTPATPHIAAFSGGFFMPAVWAPGACQ